MATVNIVLASALLRQNEGHQCFGCLLGIAGEKRRNLTFFQSRIKAVTAQQEPIFCPRGE